MNWDFSHFLIFPYYIYKEKNDKNDKYRNLVIPIVLTNNFHIEYSTKTDNSKILIFLFFLRIRVYVETQNLASPGKTDCVAYRETQNFASLQATRTCAQRKKRKMRKTRPTGEPLSNPW